MKASNLDRENMLSCFMTLQEEKDYFNEVCDRIIANPRYYLDNLEEMYVFKVSFIHYKPNKEHLRPKGL